MTVDAGKIHVLPPDVPWMPESVEYDTDGSGYIGNYECDSKIPVSLVPNYKEFVREANAGEFLCTLPQHDDSVPHGCLYRVPPGEMIRFVVWGGE